MKANTKITLHQHDDNWLNQYKTILDLLDSTCAGLFESIEHIGSTAISGIQAKNIIDIQCGVLDFSQLDVIESKLKPLGFKLIKEFKQDHVPFKDHDYLELGWEKRFFTGIYNDIECNIHVRIIGSKNWNFAIQFRDFLNHNKEIALAYEQIKDRLAESGISSKYYTMIKDPVCDLIYFAMSNATKGNNQ